MAVLARVTTFTASTLIQSSQVNAELDQLVNILNGSKTDTTVHIINNTASPGVIMDQTSTGSVASFRASGVEKTKINSNGLLESVVTTGTAPFVVASTTQVDNLNAASVGGVAASNLVKNNANNTITVTGAINSQVLTSDTANQLVFHDTNYDDPAMDGAYFRLRQNSRILKFGVSDDSLAYEDIIRLNGSTGRGQMETTFGSGTWSDLATESYVESKVTAWSFGVFYAGAIDTSVVQAIWVVPNDVDVITMDRIRWVFQNGSPTGTSQIKLQHKNSLGVEQNSSTVSILSTDTALNSYELNVADWTLSEGDFLQWTVVADGGHQDISIHAQGTQTVI